jgi:rare lipoprotein A
LAVWADTEAQIAKDGRCYQSSGTETQTEIYDLDDDGLAKVKPMKCPAGQTPYRLAHRWLAVAAALVSCQGLPVAQAAEIQRQAVNDGANGLRREAPVFTYHQFTSKLPPLAPTSESPGDVEAASLGQDGLPSAGTSEPVPERAEADATGKSGPARVAEVGATSRSRGPDASTPGASRSQPAGAGETPDTGSTTERPAAPGRTKLIGSGRASWYQHHGRTASGEIYNPNRLTAAHHKLPFGTLVKVVNKSNGRSVIVKITDRTNENTKMKRDYAIDLSRASAQKLGIDGIGQVALYTVN